MTVVMELGFWGEDLNGWLQSPYIVICLLCMIQNYKSYTSMGFCYGSPSCTMEGSGFLDVHVVVKL
jgi:hypothetical protein